MMILFSQDKMDDSNILACFYQIEHFPVYVRQYFLPFLYVPYVPKLFQG